MDCRPIRRKIGKSWVSPHLPAWNRMTIIIEGQTLSRLPASVDDLFVQFPSLKNDATKLVSRPAQRIDSSTEKILYVTQKEYAIVTANDERISILGSDEGQFISWEMFDTLFKLFYSNPTATTCHILILENPAESVLCLAHVDSADNLQSLTNMVIDVLGNSNISTTVLELSFYGGYVDERMQSENLTLDLLAFYHQLRVQIRLKAACVGPANTVFRDGINWPIIYGIAVDIRSEFSIIPATFDLHVRGPCLPLRSARLFCNKETLYRWRISKSVVLLQFLIQVPFLAESTIAGKASSW